jgi:hypothetical protein
MPEGRRVSPQHCRPSQRHSAHKAIAKRPNASIRAAKHHLFTELFVPLPAGGGEMRDLVIGASRLSESELIKIAAAGLAA